MANLLTTRQLQDLLKVDRTTIYRMIDQGSLPAVRVGGQWRFPVDQVEVWLKTQTPLSSPAPQAVVHEANDDLATLLPLECVQLIQDAFAEVLGVMLVVTDLDSQAITEVSNAGRLYQLLAKSNHGLGICQEKWKELARIPALEPRFAVGFGGLLCARALVRIGNELRAMVIAFGVAPDEWPPSEDIVAQLAGSLGVPTGHVRDTLESVPSLPPEGRRTALVTIQRIADVLAHIGNERLALRERFATIANLCTL